MHTIVKAAVALGGIMIAGAAAAQVPPPPYSPKPVLSADLGDNGNEVFTGVDDTDTGQLCYMLYATNVQNPTGAFIADSKTKTSVLALQPPKGGTSGDCTMIGKDLARKFVDHPGDYAVYVESAAYPGGRAAEGRLVATIPDKPVA